MSIKQIITHRVFSSYIHLKYLFINHANRIKLLTLHIVNRLLIKKIKSSYRFDKTVDKVRIYFHSLLSSTIKILKLKNKKNILYVRCRYLQRLCGYACSRRDRLSVRDRENKAGEKCCRSRSLIPIGRFTGYSRLCGRFIGYGSIRFENK